MNSAQDGIRHTLATIAFRLSKAVGHNQASFPGLDMGHGVRTPLEILHHMTAVIQYGSYLLSGKQYDVQDIGSWNEQMHRFLQELQSLDDLLVRKEYDEMVLGRLIQGPVSDVLTHIGQLALLSRIHGVPVAALNYSKQDITAGRLKTYFLDN